MLYQHLNQGNHFVSESLCLINQKSKKKKTKGFFDENFSAGQNELIGEDNIENGIDTIEPGLSVKNVDKSVTVNECEGRAIAAPRKPDKTTIGIRVEIEKTLFCLP